MTRNRRLTKSILLGLSWILLTVPIDFSIIQSKDLGPLVLVYEATLQALEFVVITFLIYKYISNQLHRPWKCPACDGFGVRFFTPGQEEGKFYGQMKCIACKGTGVIWEVITEGVV